jgi:hypothetical protein
MLSETEPTETCVIIGPRNLLIIPASLIMLEFSIDERCMLTRPPLAFLAQIILSIFTVL